MALYEIKAELTGMVARLDKAVGDPVDLDESVMTLESMKMQIPVLSPRRGRIVAFHVAEGQVVQERQKLATVDVG